VTALYLTRILVAAALAAGVSGAQPAASLSFEVASVKFAAAPIATRDDYSAGYNAGMRAGLAEQGLRISGVRVTITDNTLRDLIRLAYRVKDYQIAGPGWMAAEKYEIAAAMPAGSDRSQAPLMLQTLLKDRFHLELRREKRQLAAYALTSAKGQPKLTASADTSGGRGGVALMYKGPVRGRSASLADLADFLTKYAERPVLDQTGIAGTYDFEFTLPAADGESPDASAVDRTARLATAIKQIGLKLDGRKLPVEMLVVERAERVPTEN
jgi:uncharacterized protein (TIGR03435 family)